MQLGLGLYTLTDAARLVHSQPRTLKRWLCGHSYMAGKEGARQRHQVHALWQPQYDAQALGEVVIGFQDLLELRVVREFVQHGVPLQVVRRCLATARDLFGTDHPLTCRRFVTDGATIFTESLQQVQAQASDAEHDAALLNLHSRQYAFRTIIKDSLYAGIEYSDGLARCWYPEPRSRAVVLDPARQFGHPVVDESSVPTAALYACYLSEGQSKAAVARVFEVPVKHVEAAVRFEEKLRQAA